MARNGAALEAHLFVPDAKRLEDLGFAAIAQVPVLFEKSGAYAFEMNRYLRERVLAEWPDETGPSQIRAPRFLRPKSISQIAHQLLNFLKFLEHDKVGVDWREISFDPHVVAYRSLQLSGKWSRYGDSKDPQPLSLQTVEPRVATAIDFLSWAASRGYRKTFKAPGKRTIHSFRSDSSSRTQTKMSRRRIAGARPNPIDLRIPTKTEISSWQRAVYDRKGFTKGLACETILKLALRRLECAELRVDILPDDESRWRIVGDEVMIRLTEGTKGGKARTIAMPLSLAQKVTAYKRGRRLKSLAKWIRGNPALSRPEKLFLSEHNGAPMSPDRIYDAWTTQQIYPGWSPHLARHTWACFELLDAIRVTAAQINVTPQQMPATMVQSLFDTLMSTRIQGQLGHVSAETSRAYMQWLQMNVLLPAVFRRWHDFLEDDA